MGRGSSGIGAGKANGKGGAVSGWKKDYNDAMEQSEKLSKQAAEMDDKVKAAKTAYYNAPTRSKAQKAESSRLEEEMNRLTMEQSILRYRAAQISTFADRLRMENDTRYRNKKNREAAANARRNYR